MAETTAFSILVIEDDEATRDVMTMALTDEGFAVVEADGGDAAWAALRGQRPDLILVDLHMPTLDGFAFVDELHRHDEWRGIPVLVVSAEPRLANGIAGHDVAGFVAKPFDLDDLIAKVREFLPASAP